VSRYQELNRRAPVGAVCRALASRSRIQILNCLRMGPKSVDQIASAMPMISRPAISQHLRMLLEANLVTAKRKADGAFTGSTCADSRFSSVIWTR